jgi:hypothetical protein
MNYRGSYRHLVKNSKAAMVAAIEIYNKPRFEYREECCVILLMNAWELVLKALLSKSGRSIFYPKKRKESYRTLGWSDALAQAIPLFPASVDALPVKRNLDLLATYRDNAVHFYNAKGFGSVLYALAQTSIVNFKDVLAAAFKIDLGDEITWQLLPLGLRTPIDPIEYISGKTPGSGKQAKPAVQQFLKELSAATKEVEDAAKDTGRLLTVFTVKLESRKKIEDADVVVGVTKAAESPGPLAVVKTLDPNVSHPLRQLDVVQKIPELHGARFTSFTFQAIVWKYDLKNQPRYCWQAKEGVLTKYSNEVLPFIRGLSAADVQTALQEYRAHLKNK